MQSIAAAKAQCPEDSLRTWGECTQHRLPQARYGACALPGGMLARWAWQPTALSRKPGQRAKDRHQLGGGCRPHLGTVVTGVKMSRGPGLRPCLRRESCSGHKEKGSGRQRSWLPA